MATIPELLTELEHALNVLTDALASGYPDAVLAAEPLVAESAAKLAAAAPLASAVERMACWHQVLAVREAMGRAQLLGAVSASFQFLTTPEATYGASGRATTARSTLDSRV